MHEQSSSRKFPFHYRKSANKVTKYDCHAKRKSFSSSSTLSFFLLASLSIVLLYQTISVETRSVEEQNNTLQQSAKLTISEKPKAKRKDESQILNDLLGRISSALQAVGGDAQAIQIGADATTSSNAATDSSGSAAGGQKEGEREEDGNNNCRGSECPPLTENGELSEESLRNLTDHERLIELQTTLQDAVKSRLMGTARASMELFDEMSLSGGCSSSLLSLMSGISEIKAYAFKFLDASAKIPSGVMYGLLSDFGDFDQCLSIRANPEVSPEHEVDEGTFSGKYCLLNLRLNYHVQMGSNSTAPDGIYEDGVLWDQLVRRYWTTNSQKGFQVAICVPSRCNSEDLDQIYRALQKKFNVLGEIMSCQDSNDLRKQTTPDLIQRIILCVFLLLFLLNFVGTLFDRYWLDARLSGCSKNIAEGCNKSRRDALIYGFLVSFSIRRNWALFMRKQDAATVLAFHHDERPHGADTQIEPDEVTTAGNSLPKFNNRYRLASRMVGSLVSISPNHGSPFSKRTCTLTSEASNDDFICTDRANDDFRDQPYSAQPLMARENGNCEKLQEPPEELDQMTEPSSSKRDSYAKPESNDLLSHLSGLKLFVIIWITIGHSFLYPSANNYQYYRSIINMKITRDSVWFAATNFTLGIDMLLYITGLVFVYNLTRRNSMSQKGALKCSMESSHESVSARMESRKIVQEFTRRILRFWPTYLCVIAVAIVIPLFGDGPMWPEMVSRRLGQSCRQYWWANLLMINNFFDQSDVCLPSSWFVSVLMQSFFVGSLVMLVAQKYSILVANSLIAVIVGLSSAFVFMYAYFMEVGAPIIRMDESFVLEIDENIYRLYTNLFNNLGPFLVGMVGGFVLIHWKNRNERRFGNWQPMNTLARATSGPVAEKYSEGEGSQDFLPNVAKQSDASKPQERRHFDVSILQDIAAGIITLLIAFLVLSSAFQTNLDPFWSAIYWSTHRIGWAIVISYVIHQCATGRWLLLKDLLSLSHFIPLSRLIFIAYLVYPIFIHMHSGLVRDGLHVSLYNMANIYITRLVLTFTLSLLIHLLVELPFCSMEAIILSYCLPEKALSTENLPKTSLNTHQTVPTEKEADHMEQERQENTDESKETN